MKGYRRDPISQVQNASLGHGQIVLLSVGGIIGGGFFFGVGDALRLAGPSVILSFLLIGVVAITINFFLIEMSLSPYGSPYFHQYIEHAFGPAWGLTVGWAYMLGMVAGPASEIIIIGIIVQRWLQGFSLVLICLLIAVAIFFMRFLCEPILSMLEAMTAFLRLFVLLGFGLVGAASVFGLFSGTIRTVGFANYTSHGFFPNGICGTMSACIGIIMAYGGTESVGVLSDGKKQGGFNVPSIFCSISFRLVFLYCFTMFSLAGVLPFQEAAPASNPFAQAIDRLALPKIVSLLFFAVIVISMFTLVLTDINLTVRLLNQMKLEYFSHRPLKTKNKISRSFGVEAITWFVVLFLAVFAVLLWQGDAYLHLFYLSGFGFTYIWMMIALAYPKFLHKVYSDFPDFSPSWRAPFPHVFRSIALLILLASIFYFSTIPLGLETLLIGFLLLLVVYLFYRFRA